jgi:hypothetical protein
LGENSQATANGQRTKEVEGDDVVAAAEVVEGAEVGADEAGHGQTVRRAAAETVAAG